MEAVKKANNALLSLVQKSILDTSFGVAQNIHMNSVGQAVESTKTEERMVIRSTIAVEAMSRLEGFVVEHNRRVAKLLKRHNVSIEPATLTMARTLDEEAMQCPF